MLDKVMNFFRNFIISLYEQGIKFVPSFSCSSLLIFLTGGVLQVEDGILILS